jgi:hypothetical protein
VARSLADIVPAAEKNPAFANSYDWHSSVHMHYLLASLLGDRGGAERAGWRERGASRLLSSHLSDVNMLAEAAFLRENPSWERPYGWAWAVELDRVLNASEVRRVACARREHPGARGHVSSSWCPRGCRRWPLRCGTGCTRTRRSGCGGSSWAPERLDRDDVVDMSSRARLVASIAEDAAWNFAQERSGHDFLSPGLCVADLMAEVLTDGRAGRPGCPGSCPTSRRSRQR